MGDEHNKLSHTEFKLKREVTLHHDKPNEHTVVARSARRRAIFGAATVLALGAAALVATPASADTGDLVITPTYDGSAVPGVNVTLYRLDTGSGQWQYETNGTTDGDGTYTFPNGTLSDGQYSTLFDPTDLPANVAPYATYQQWNGTIPVSDSDYSTEFTVSDGDASIGSITVPLLHNGGAFTVTAKHATSDAPFVDDPSSYDELWVGSDSGYSPDLGRLDSLNAYQQDAEITGVLTESHLPAGAYPRAYMQYYNQNQTPSYTYDSYLPLVTITAGATTSIGDVSIVNSDKDSVDTLITTDWTSEITGAAAVGKVLTVQQPTAPGVTFSYQWYAVGLYGEVNRPIVGATSQTYVPTAFDLGQQLGVDVIASAPGLGQDTRFGYSQSTPVKVGDPNQGTVAITGAVKYGQTVSASVSTSLEGASAFQWYLNGNPIAGATGSTYAIKSTDVGAALSVSVKSVVQGHTDAVIPSASVIVAADDANTGSVAITGSAKFGKTVKASVATALAGNVSYQWFRNGVLVGGVDGSSYAIGKADLGKALTVVARSTAQGHADAVLISAPVAIAKDAASVKATAAKKITTKKSLKVTVSLKPGTTKISATAKVKVYYSAKKFKTVTVKSGKSASVKLPKLSKGTHTIKVVYPGTASYKAKTVTFKVKVTK